MDLSNYALNLKKVNKVKCPQNREQIHNYYIQMIECNYRKEGDLADHLFRTLSIAGYLIDIRDKKLKNILDGK